MSEDVVAELERWRTTVRTAENAHEFVPMSELLRRARDEIMRLRGHADGYETFPSVLECQELCRKARAEALEEAARLHEQVYVGHHQDPMAAVIEYRDLIRALKDKGDD